ncbi:hypothetical protein [Actinomarinicola tropica]|uniref:Uncharacterized protein n=1 Tax=Actinomarinicola tropica TaxID=2789776 RepID=A0A5Q2RJY8_9ACTN|nr:hypothetical protein [Actinomarinicola tropica]QGG94881.1 hypothetical protein GH723_07035 [Actinomarinicola tropica]
MGTWSRVQVGLLVVAVAVFAVVAVLAFMVLEPDQEECVVAHYDGAPDTDLAPEDALAEFVAANQDRFPGAGWEVASTDGDTTTFTNEADGGHEVVVERGAVRSFESCD